MGRVRGDERRGRRADGWPGFLADCSATTLVEFAFIAPVLLLLLLGMIEIARFTYIQSTLEIATVTALRAATIDPLAADGSVLQVLRDNLAGVDPGRVADFTVTRVPEPGTSLIRITIRVAMTFEPIVSLIFPEVLRIEATARGVGVS